MTELERLIAELCPEGVEYVGVESVCSELLVGGDLPQNYAKGQKEPSAEFPYPIYSNGTEDSALYGYTDSYKVEKPAVTISARGTIGYHAIRYGKFTPIVRLITLVADESKIMTKFLNYALSVAGLEGVTTGIPSLTLPMLKKNKIPLPPLPIQHEIVRILDKFTELTARKKQYEYYRDLLLTFGDDVAWVTANTKLGRLIAEFCPDGVEYKTLGEIATITRGSGLPKSDFTEADIPCIHYGQIYTYYGTFPTKTKSFVSPETASRLKKVSKGDIIIAVTSENLEDVCKCIAWLGDEDIVTGGHTAILNHNQNPKYIAYWLQTEEFFKQKRMIAHGTKVIEVTPSKLANISISLPPLPVQHEIVRILDRFHALTTDITKGLPAEIAARQKQYEYYRDKLLTFKEIV